jgi:hypothetical protein
VSDEPSPIGDDIEVEVEFLTVEVVLALHQRQLVLFGGAAGLRDLGLLESAVAQPLGSFRGTYGKDGLVAKSEPGRWPFRESAMVSRTRDDDPVEGASGSTEHHAQR